MTLRKPSPSRTTIDTTPQRYRPCCINGPHHIADDCPRAAAVRAVSPAGCASTRLLFSHRTSSDRQRCNQRRAEGIVACTIFMILSFPFLETLGVTRRLALTRGHDDPCRWQEYAGACGDNGVSRRSSSTKYSVCMPGRCDDGCLAHNAYRV